MTQPKFNAFANLAREKKAVRMIDVLVRAARLVNPQADHRQLYDAAQSFKSTDWESLDSLTFRDDKVSSETTRALVLEKLHALADDAMEEEWAAKKGFEL